VVFDLLVLGLVLLAAGLGAWKGFAWQMAHVLSPIAGLGLGWPLSALLAPLNRLAAFGLLYLALSFLVHLAALGFRRLLERARLAPWDHHVGFVAGALKGCVLAILLASAALAAAGEPAAPLRATWTGRLMGALVEEVTPSLPPVLQGLVRPVCEPRT
jgi:uncharacterized membrane protein required for colicin V production